MKIASIFPKDSEALFNSGSERTFGGANIQMYIITRELHRYSDIATYSFIPRYTEIDFADRDSFNLIPTFREEDPILKKFWIYHRMIRKIRPDVIFQRGLTLFSCLLACYCRFFRIKFVFMFAHDIESEGRYQKNGKRCLLFPLLLQCSYLLIAQNEFERRNIAPRAARKVQIIKKGIDLTQLPPPGEKIYDCIWIGRCERWKDPEAFLDLAVQNRKLHFLMICSKAPGRENYFEIIREKAAPIQNLKFIDYVSYREIYTLLAQSRVFCITSEMEGDWPMTVLEAAASKLPILSLRLNYGNLLGEYRAGFYCNGSPATLSKKLQKLIEDEGLYREMSEGAFRYVNENHDVKRTVQRLVKYVSK